MKLAIICYLPPKRIYPTDAFLENIRRFPSKNPLYLFSDEDYGPDVIKLGGSVEIAKTPSNKMGVNNLIFFTGIRIAASKGITHVMVIENDVRVNKPHWDEDIWNEFKKKPDAIMGGSMVFFNPCSFNRAGAEKYEKIVAESLPNRLVPLSMTGSSNLAEQRDSCIFPNGAFAIYRMDWLLATFPEIVANGKTVALAQACRTWDYEAGVRLWEQFKERAYDKVVQINCIYSGYGNILSTEEDRKKWLIDRKIVGVHQIKSDWVGPDATPVQDLVPAPEVSKPVKMELFLVTYHRDFEYLKFCLSSIRKFCSGFSGVTILVPTQDVKALRELVDEFKNAPFPVQGVPFHIQRPIPIHVKSGYEWKNKGFLWHMAQICRADKWCPDAEMVAHIDPDCIFTKPCSPETFLHNGKPIVQFESFESLTKRHPGVGQWKTAIEACLPFEVQNEYMRQHPEIYRIEIYEQARTLVEKKTGQPFDAYVGSCKNSFPQNFAEFPLLGAVASEHFPKDYHFIDRQQSENPDLGLFPVGQFWSHQSPDMAQDIWWDGKKQSIVPMEKVKELGLI